MENGNSIPRLKRSAYVIMEENWKLNIIPHPSYIINA
jgi:hypothetical protein